MTKEENEKFDAVFKDVGGRYYTDNKENDESFNIGLKQVIDDAEGFIKYLRRSRYVNLPYINFNIINNPTLNACAVLVGDEYYIGLNVGSFLLVNDMFSKMFSNKEIFSNIGNVSLETTSAKKLSRFIYNDEIYFNTKVFESFLPQDPIRGSFSMMLSWLAINYLVHHEIGHIIRGHCGYYKSISYKQHWSELELKQFDNPFHFQTMEMDADSFAVNYAFLSTDNVAQAKADGKTIDYPWNLIYTDIEIFFHYWTFAIYSFHRLCNIEHFNEEETNQLSHPPPSVRISLMMNNILSIMEKRNMPKIESMSNMLVKTIVEAELAFSKITYEENKPDIFFSNHVLSTNYTEKLMRNWNNVLPLIKPFAIAPESLPPPVT